MAGHPASGPELRVLADELRAAGRPNLAAQVLVRAARRSLEQEHSDYESHPLADALRDHQQFRYARLILRRLCEEHPTIYRFRTQYALCVYRDAGLPAARRLARALQILSESGPLDDCRDADTLGLAGTVFQRKWELEGRRADLENARWCFERGSDLDGDPSRWDAAVRAAFVFDQLAGLTEEGVIGQSSDAAALRARAAALRNRVVEQLRVDPSTPWDIAARGEALFGLGRFSEAKEAFTAVLASTPERWRLESLARDLVSLARLQGQDLTSDGGEAAMAMRVLVDDAALRRAHLGRVGVALSGGGFRASLFHLGVLAFLAERDVLRSVEVLSCVSGGSIVGAFYYLKLRQLLQSKPDAEITARDYADLVDDVLGEFLDAVRRNLRVRLTEKLSTNWRMLATGYSRTDRAAQLYDELIFRRVHRDDSSSSAWRMPDLAITPSGASPDAAPGPGRELSTHHENAWRHAKVPELVINATTLNTGHTWVFTTSWMGEPPPRGEHRDDANRRLYPLYYYDVPDADLPRLADAVAASACVPMLFPPLRLDGLYDGICVELVDGGVHDNQGIGSQLEHFCDVVLVSDASGHMADVDRPGRSSLSVGNRSNSVLMTRVRGAQVAELIRRRRSGLLRGVMVVDLKKGLPALRVGHGPGSLPLEDRDRDELFRAETRRPGSYGIHERVQRALASIRTDLDSFSDDEAYGLMAAGYLMARVEFESSLRDIPAPTDAVKPSPGWAFEQHIKNLASPHFAESLAVAHLRFGRGPRRLLRRLRKPRDEPGSLPGGPPAVVRTSTRLALAPLRAVLAVVPAAAAALTTRAWLTTFGRAGRSR